MEDVIRLLQIQEVSTIGVLLAVLFVAAVGLRRDWWVTGNRWNAKVADCDKVANALTAANAELKAIESEYVTARIDLARMEERERLHGDTPRPRTRRT